MKKGYLRFFAVSLVFLCVAIVFYTESGVTLGKFLLFFVSGVASGANLVQGIVSWRQAKNG
jgi:hypothetical protein